MAGTAVDRELGLRFSVATPEDDGAIRQLLRESPMAGSIQIGFEREPDYFSGNEIAGGNDRTILAYRGAELVCMGRCTERLCWMNGEPVTAAYLAELRMHHRSRGQFSILRAGYQFFHEQERLTPAGVYFTSIASDNDRARRILEKGARGMPEYRFLSELVTLLIPVPNRPPKSELNLEPTNREDIEPIADILNSSRNQLAPVWTAERLSSLERHALPLSSFRVLKDGGVILAAGALWDQRCFRQTVIHGYSGALARSRPVINLVSRFLGTPHLPAPGSVLRHAYLSPLGFRADAESLLPRMVSSVVALAHEQSLDYVTLALPASSPWISELQARFRARTWRSRLYQVVWPGSRAPLFQSGTFHPDVALL